MSVRQPGKHAMMFIFITVLIDMIGFGLIIPVMPDLIKGLTGQDAPNAAVMGGWLMSLYAGMQFIFAPIVGGLSDRFGRKPILLIALAGFTLDYLIMGFSGSFLVLFIGRAISGIFGASYTTASAYIADISDDKNRAANFGMIGAAFGLGFIMGPVAGGFLGEAFGPRAPFFAAAALAGLNFIYGFFVLPESLPVENRRKFELRRANPFGALMRIRKHPVVYVLLSGLFVIMLAHSVFPSTWSYFGEFRFGWSKQEIGFSLGAVGLMTALVQGGLTRVVVPAFGEWRVIMFALTVTVLAYVGYGLVTQVWMVYLVIVFGALGGLGQPALQAVMTRRVAANAQGELQGAITSLQGLSMMIGPQVMPRVFQYFTSDNAPAELPGAAFLLAAGLASVGLVVTLSARRRDRVSSPAQ